MNKISEELLRKEYIDNQLSMRAIGLKYGINLSTVFNMIDEAGIPSRPAGRQKVVTPELRARILAMRADYRSIGDIAHATGVSQSAIWVFLKSEGLPMFWRRAPIKRLPKYWGQQARGY